MNAELDQHLRERWLDIDHDVRPEAAEAIRRGVAHPVIDGIRRESVASPLYRGVPVLRHSDPLGLLRLRQFDKIEIPPCSFSKDPAIALRFAELGLERGLTIPVILQVTSSRVDGRINGIDLLAPMQEVISGGYFTVTGVGPLRVWPGESGWASSCVKLGCIKRLRLGAL